MLGLSPNARMARTWIPSPAQRWRQRDECRYQRPGWMRFATMGSRSRPSRRPEAERLTRRYVARIIPLAFLAPDITEVILEGSQLQDLTLAKLCQCVPLAWPQQRRARPPPYRVDRSFSIVAWASVPTRSTEPAMNAICAGKHRSGGRGRARRPPPLTASSSSRPAGCCAHTPVCQNGDDERPRRRPHTIPRATSMASQK
jgi:hypothetical protein